MQPIHSLVSTPFKQARRLAGITAMAFTLMALSTTAQAQYGGSSDPMAAGNANITAPGTNGASGGANDASGSAQLRQSSRSNDRSAIRSEARAPVGIALPPYVPSEFERYVQSQEPTQRTSSSPKQVRRFGSNLLTDYLQADSVQTDSTQTDSAQPNSQQTDPLQTSIYQDPLPSVPGDYIIKPGDEIALTIWGSVDADLRLTVDRSGLISVPRVGSITVGGVQYADLASTITRRTERVFKNFQLTATLGQVRAMRVYVSGYARRPGSITVSGLASVLNVLMRAGGPSAAGSFRDIRLNRGGHQIATFDLYDLLLKGTRESDKLVQPDDVIFIGPVGPQVALIGSVNQQAIFELKPGEVLADVLRMAGGFTAVADRSKVTIERLADRGLDRVSELDLPAQANTVLATGDLLRAYSSVAAQLPRDRQNKRVHVEGEVVRPGDYILPPGSTVADALRAAGGMTPAAFPYGTEFTRESVRLTQQTNFDRALRDLETDMVKNQATQRSTSLEETATQNATAASNARLIERLRQVRPTGRVVMPVDPDATSIPDFPLENGDAFNIPSRGTSVGVFGSVFNTGSFVFAPNHTAADYLRLAGGPTRGADKTSIFMIRANGSVVSAQQGASFWHSGNELLSAIVLPGDTLFVPEELSKSTFIQDAKDWTQILYQFGLGVAGIKSLGL